METIKLVDVAFSHLNGIKLKLLEIDGKLDMLSAGYALQRYERGSRPNTIKKDSQAIQHLYRYCIEYGIDIHEIIASQHPFSIGQIESYSAFCSINLKTKELIGSDYYQQRMGISWAFIKWLWLFYQNRTKNTLDILKAAKLQFSTMKAGFELYMDAPYTTGKKDKEGLSPELRIKFMSIINPLSENQLNPWKASHIRWRNYALLLTMILGGNRKGESLLLRIDHFALTGKRKYFEIIKSGDIDYPRSEAPSIKTLGREVVLTELLAEIFEHYITVSRKEFKGADKSMYMFLSNKDGDPLSVQTPNAILNTLIKKYPEFKGVLSPHRLRNTFHDILNVALNMVYSDESAMGRKLLKKPLQEYAGGWKSGSEMPNHYSKGSIKRNVAELQKKIQQQLINNTSYDDTVKAREIELLETKFKMN